MDWTTLIGYLINPLTAFVSWVAGTRSRRNTAIRELMETINELSKQVSEYQARIIDLQKEVLAVRNENAQLKAGQELMTAKMTELQRENAELKQILTKIKHK